MTDTHTLLAEYVRSGSEAAFRDLVGRYLDLVYSSALRLVGGDAQLAEDVSQTVFLNLARKARSLPRDVMLGGWLHQDACFAARALMRRERRRQKRERLAMEMRTIEYHSESNLANLMSLLDEAIEELKAEDRAAILLRFFEQRDFHSIGLALGSSEEAARKRVGRALDRLHVLLRGHGVNLSGLALGVVLAEEAVTAAPTGLAASIAGTALAGAGAGTGLPATLLKLITMTKIQSTLLGAIVLLGATTSMVLHHQAQAAIRTLDDSLQRQSEELARQEAENERLAGLVSSSTGDANSFSDLVRLRREVESLHNQAKSLNDSRDEKTNVTFPILQRREEDTRTGIARLMYLKRWLQAFRAFANQNGNQFPTTFNQALPFLPEDSTGPVAPEEAVRGTDLRPEQFEIVYRGPATNIAHPDLVVVLRERQPCRAYDGQWTRAHGFLDGHSEVNFSADGDYTAWEKRKIVGPPVDQ